MGRTVERMLGNLNQSILFNIIYIMRTNVTDNKLLTNKIRPLFLQADFSKCELFNFMHAFVCIDTQYTAIVVDDLMIGIAEKC